jgi:cytochrome P450
VIGNGMLALLQHPAQWQALRHDATLVATAVEEMMRYDTPLQLFRRWVLEDMVYKGFSWRPGIQVGLIFGAANRDPARFARPHTFDIRRQDDPHLSFGAGVHYCLGAPLARLEIQIALVTLLQRLPYMKLTGPEPRFRPAYVIHGLEALHVTF